MVEGFETSNTKHSVRKKIVNSASTNNWRGRRAYYFSACNCVVEKTGKGGRGALWVRSLIIHLFPQREATTPKNPKGEPMRRRSRRQEARATAEIKRVSYIEEI